MRVLVTGSHGLIGSALVRELTRQGHDVLAAVRVSTAGRSAPAAPQPGGRSEAPADVGLAGLGRNYAAQGQAQREATPSSNAAALGTPPTEPAMGAYAQPPTGARPAPHEEQPPTASHAAPHDAAGVRQVAWELHAGLLEPHHAEGIEAVVHLAGEPLEGRWDDAKKRAILESRVIGTASLVRSLGSLKVQPRVLVSASAVGFYGDRGDETLDEYSHEGTGFLPTVTREWEKAAASAENMGIRTVFARMGIVLDAHGGALSRMLPVIRTGLAGPMGNGRQFWSWVTLHDAVRALIFLLRADTLRGPVNVTSPQPVRNREFVDTIGRVLNRATVMRVPAAVLRLALGELANETLLASARVQPLRLQQAGFTFDHPQLTPALAALLREAAVRVA